MVTQDAAGVVYRARDRESGREVAVRRLNGVVGEMVPDAAVTTWIGGRLAAAARVKHDRLRAVVAGGCDPVDGVPYVVTEWADGRSLDDWLEGRQLTAAEAWPLLVAVLEISALHEEAFGEAGIWVELAAGSVVVAEEEAGGGIWFRLCLAAVTGGAAPTPKALGSFLEELLGWKGRAFTDQSGDGLGRWLKWIGGRGAGASAADALEALKKPAIMMASDAGEGIRKVSRRAAARRAIPGFLQPGRSRPVVNSRSGNPAGAARWAAALLVLAGLGGWFYWKLAGTAAEGGRGAVLAEEVGIAAVPAAQAASPPPVAAVAGGDRADAPRVEHPARGPEDDRIQRAQELAARLREEARQRPTVPPRVAVARSEPVGVFGAGQVEELMARRHREVVVEGVLVEVLPARAGQHLYFEFSPSGRPPYLTRGILRVAGPDQMAERDQYLPWVGKRVRLRGKADVERFRDGDRHVARPKIGLHGPDDIELIE